MSENEYMKQTAETLTKIEKKLNEIGWLIVLTNMIILLSIIANAIK